MKTPQEFLTEPQRIREHINLDYRRRVEAVEKAVRLVDAEYAFQALVCSKLLSASEGYSEREHGLLPSLIELAAYYLYPHFGGANGRNPPNIQKAIDSLTELNKMRGWQIAFDRDREASDIASMQIHLRLAAESVRGSSYPSLIRDRIEGVQVPFETWFNKEVGIGPGRALAILDASERAINDNLRAHQAAFKRFRTGIEEFRNRLRGRSRKKGNELELDEERATLQKEFDELTEKSSIMLPPSFPQIALEVPRLTMEEWVAFRALVGFTQEERQRIGQPNEVKARPVYFLSGDRFIFFDLSSVYDALFEAYDQMTRSDTSFRGKRYVPNLSRWIENKTCECLKRLFPEGSVYKQLTYPNPDPVGGEAELDAAVHWGPFLVLCEVKGTQFRQRSRLGDPPRLFDDLKDGIEEAFNQASRADRFINAHAEVTFTEKNTGRKLVVERRSVQRVFPVSITLHHFAGLATQLAALKQLGLFQDSAYPWSASISDFDVITRFAGSPDVLLHYIQRRLDLQRSEKQVVGDELDIFGLYLDSRLHPSEYWSRKADDGREYDRLILRGGSERFDQWFQAEGKIDSKQPDIRLNLPTRFAEIIKELQSRHDDDSRWVTFALLGLSQRAVSDIEQGLSSLRTRARADNRLRRFTIKDGNVVISLVTAVGLGIQQLRKYTVFRAAAEKYRLKAEASVALSIDPSDNTRPFDCAFWISGPWEKDSQFDEFIANERPKLLPGQRLPTRNEPCPCGSGMKFKKCCIKKYKVLPPYDA